MEKVASKVEVVIRRKDDKLNEILKELKCEVLKDFEKICPTDMSFQRIKKDMHDKFDNAYRQAQQQL
jgi:hypothetical protein